MMTTITTAASTARNVTMRGPCTCWPVAGGGSLGGRSTIRTGRDGTASRRLLTLSLLAPSEVEAFGGSGSDREGIARIRAVRMPSLDVIVGAVAIATS